MPIELHLQAIITVLSLVNPVMCAAIFQRIERDRSRKAELADATIAALAILAILVLAALVGVSLLKLFGVSLDAFSVAGGGILSWIGFSMLSGKSAHSDHSDNTTNTSANRSQSLKPLVLFAASPGTITGVITLSVAHSRSEIPITALMAVLLATMITWLVLIMVTSLGRRDSQGGFFGDTVRSFMGLIVIAMGVQFALTGIRSFMSGG